MASPALLLFALLISPTRAGDCLSYPVAQTVDTVRSVTNTGAEQVVVDANSLFKNGPDVDLMAAVLRGVANEPGEKGYVNVKVNAAGKIGTGAVNGAIDGNIALELAYSVTDQNEAILGMDLAAALKAGVNLAGLVELGGKVEVSGSLVKVSFKNSRDAAAWVTQQLDAINKRTGSKLWPAGNIKIPAGTGAPIAIQDIAGTAGVYAQGGLGKVNIAGEGKVKREYRNYKGVMDGRKVDITATIDHVIGEASLKVPFKNDQAEVKYTYDNAETTGSPYYMANAHSIRHVVDIKVPISAASKTFSKTGTPTEGAQDLLLNVFGAIEKLAPGTALKGANYKVFSEAVATAYKNAERANKLSAKTVLTVTLEIKESVAKDGSTTLQYQRLFIGGEQQLGAQFNVKAVNVGVNVAAGKTELVLENLGTETTGYFKRQYLYENADRPWASFKEENRSALESLVGNMATPGSKVYNQGVADAVKQGGYEAGLRAMESAWKTENQRMVGAREDAVKLAELSNKWQWWYGKDALANDVSSVLEKYSAPEERQFLWDMVDDFDGSPASLQELAGRDSAAGRRLKGSLSGIKSR